MAELISRSQGGLYLNTSYIERFNATLRERLGSLTRSVKGREDDWDKLVHRTDRTDFSFFQQGRRILEEFVMCGRTGELEFALVLNPLALF